jgi:hypothetical protein
MLKISTFHGTINLKPLFLSHVVILLEVKYYQVWTYFMPRLKAEACSNLNHDEHNDIHMENINDVYVTDYNYNWQNIQNI